MPTIDRFFYENPICVPRAKREAQEILVNPPPRAKREAQGILVKLSPRATREAEGILVNQPL